MGTCLLLARLLSCSVGESEKPSKPASSRPARPIMLSAVCGGNASLIVFTTSRRVARGDRRERSSAHAGIAATASQLRDEGRLPRRVASWRHCDDAVRGEPREQRAARWPERRGGPCGRGDIAHACAAERRGAHRVSRARAAAKTLEVSHLIVAFVRVLHCPQDGGVHNAHKAKYRPTPTAVVRSRVVSLPVLGTI